MQFEIRDEHRWLEGFTGDWLLTSDSNTPPETMTGEWIEQGRMLEGGAWLVMESRGTLPDGGAAQNLLTVGFDPAKGKYVGTWIGSTMHHLWTYEGVREGNALVLNSVGPSWEKPGQMESYQDIYTLDGDTRTLTSQVLQPDGTWQVFMTSEYRRK